MQGGDCSTNRKGSPECATPLVSPEGADSFTRPATGTHARMNARHARTHARTPGGTWSLPRRQSRLRA
eukprot:21581-Chlamydomonas_euryale.AAC.1